MAAIEIVTVAGMEIMASRLKQYCHTSVYKPIEMNWTSVDGSMI